VIGASWGDAKTISNPIFLYTQVFEIAVGNMSDPSHDFWTDYKKNHADSWMPTLMVYLIYIVWVACEVFVFIILVNFFIALVG